MLNSQMNFAGQKEYGIIKPIRCESTRIVGKQGEGEF